MILILETEGTDFTQKLRSVLQRRGVETLLISSAQLAQEVSISFSLGTDHADFQLRYLDKQIDSSDLQGIYCGIVAFSPLFFNQFSADDAQYAAVETQALWLAMLSSLSCRKINPPALDTLAGTCLSPAELAIQAHKLGLMTPAFICVENGEIAARINQSGVPARFSDLGKTWTVEINHNQVDLKALKRNPNQYFIQENPAGQATWVTIIGRRMLVCEGLPGGEICQVPSSQIPGQVRSQLRKLQKLLNLNAAEYFLKRQDNNWCLCGVSFPPRFSILAYPDEVIFAIADYLTG